MSQEEAAQTECLQGFLASELEFLAEDVRVWVKPNFSQDIIPLLGSTDANPVGPFRPPAPAEVPLWMAVMLKKSFRCTLVTPAWMELRSLDEWYAEETSRALFCPPPVREWTEISRVLLSYARDDLAPNAELIEQRLADIRDVREAKKQQGLKLMNDNIGSYIKLGNMGSAEINTIRTFACDSLAKFKRLHATIDPNAGLSDTQMQQAGGAGGGGQQAQGAPTQTLPPLATQAPASQQAVSSRPGRANFRNNNRTFGDESAAAGPADATQMSQPGAPPVEEQARKLRRFGN